SVCAYWLTSSDGFSANARGQLASRVPTSTVPAAATPRPRPRALMSIRSLSLSRRYAHVPRTRYRTLRLWGMLFRAGCQYPEPIALNRISAFALLLVSFTALLRAQTTNASL